jgi:hypothetical protein
MLAVTAVLAVAVAVAAYGGPPMAGAARSSATTTSPSPATETNPPVTNDAASGPLVPTSDPFYRWRGSLAHRTPGTVLRTRHVILAGAGASSTQVKAIQLLYVTTDELGHRTVSVATVLEPVDATGSVATRLVSYQTAYDALGARCDPSYTLQTGKEAEVVLMLRYVAVGDTVVTADYEGENLAYGAGQQSGYETLDAIRAAERWLGVPESSTPVGMVGYSGGSIATEFASELARAYAPRLDIVGVAEGGVPVDPFHNLAYVDHPGTPWTWVIPTVLAGIARGFGIRHLDKYLTPAGIAAVDANQNGCVGSYIGLTTGQMFKPRYRDVTKVPIFVRLLDHLIMSRTGTPRAPLFIVNGRSDPVGDGIMVAKDVQQLAHTYCRRKVPVQLHIDQGLNHGQVAVPFLEEAQTFLTQRFEHLPFQNGCSAISVGNSIAPIPVPSSHHT